MDLKKNEFCNLPLSNMNQSESEDYIFSSDYIKTVDLMGGLVSLNLKIYMPMIIINIIHHV